MTAAALSRSGAVTWAHDGWAPRDYQLPLWDYLQRDRGRRAICIWHRRAGKDDVMLRWTYEAAMQTVGPYWHMLPQAAQARKAIWDAVNPVTGRRRIDECFPRGLRASTREADMFIRFNNGSTWQVVGSDNYNSLVGTPPIGIVFSEFALADPNAWAYLSPILEENGGWAAFITTPRGRNHAWRMFRAAQNEVQSGNGPKKWFAQKLSVHDTKTVFTADALASARQTLIDLYGSEEVARSAFEQEYECSFEAAVIGSYYGGAIAQAEREGRIRHAVEPLDAPVHTAWDLGIGDSTAIWWWQVAGSELRIVDYYESHGVGLDHYAALIKAKPYRRGEDFVPQDAKVREFASGRTRVESMIELGLTPRVVKAHRIEDGINAVRRTLPRCVIHARRCERGLDALRLYQAEWDDETRVLANRPKHDWTSHAADAFRYLALSWQEAEPAAEEMSDWDRKYMREREELKATMAEMTRPRTMDEMWQQYLDECAERGEEEDDSLNW